VLDRWDLITAEVDIMSTYRDPAEFTRLSRDLYIPAGDMGFWQGVHRARPGSSRCGRRSSSAR
jgi:hypothetical protein